MLLKSENAMNLVKVNEKPLRLLRPTPVYLLVTGSIPDNDINIMALSWLTPISKNPPKIGIVIDKSNYSHGLLIRYKWFSLAVVDLDMADIVKYVGTHSRREEDKIEKVNLEIIPWSNDPRIPILNNVLGLLICKVEAIIDFTSSTLFISKIEEAYARDGYFNVKNGWNIEKAKILLHKAKHSFVTVCNEKMIIKTPWGIAIKKPWRAKFERRKENSKDKKRKRSN